MTFLLTHTSQSVPCAGVGNYLLTHFGTVGSLRDIPGVENVLNMQFIATHLTGFLYVHEDKIKKINSKIRKKFAVKLEALLVRI